MTKKDTQSVQRETLLDLFPPKARRLAGLQQEVEANDIVELNAAELGAVGGGEGYFNTAPVQV